MYDIKTQKSTGKKIRPETETKYGRSNVEQTEEGEKAEGERRNRLKGLLLNFRILKSGFNRTK